jgi:carboxymethylenebutenolidase
MKDQIRIAGPEGWFDAYVVRPKSQPAPAIVVLHEVFGVNEDIRRTCQELADQGLIAIAPDLFWRQERRVNLNSWSEEEWTKGLALYTAYDRDAGVRDIAAAIQTARSLEGSIGRVAVMGFCLGGLMAFLTAAREDPDVAVAYHGGDTDRYLSEASGINAPLLMHLADEDEFITKDAQSRIKTALVSVPKSSVYSYPGQRHAFARHTGVHYNAQAAALANGRTIAFLKEHLWLHSDVARLPDGRGGSIPDPDR